MTSSKFALLSLDLGIVEKNFNCSRGMLLEEVVENWNQELTLEEAFHYSCVPCYQDIARRIGVDRMVAFLDDCQFGKMEISENNIDLFWLEGNSEITPIGQIEFLVKFYQSKLPISSSTKQIAKRLMTKESAKDYTILAKTGFSLSGVGWYVGYLVKDEQPYFFATNLNMSGGVESALREEITMVIFSKFFQG